jgi:glycosyltransferase involved in cell wall biosynthesis
MISLIHPSRGRAKKAYEAYLKWVGSATCPVEYILSLDSTEPDKMGYISNNINFIVNDNNSVVEAANRAAEKSMGDILIYMSDDFDVPENWCEAVLKEFEGVTEPMLLKVHDNLQNFSARVLTIPIMNRALYEKLGYFFHPEYKSMWVDCDLFETCTKIGAIKNAPHLIFSHEHHSIGKADNDETYKRSEANWHQGLAIFNRRRREGFKI